MNSTYEYTGHGKASKENAAKIKSSSYDLVNIQYRVRKRKKTKPKHAQPEQRVPTSCKYEFFQCQFQAIT